MNNDAENELAKFEAFLADPDNQTKEETLAELASHGVRTEEFLKSVQMVVREGYSKRLKETAESEQAAAAAKRRNLFGDIKSKTRDELLAIFAGLSAGDYGQGFCEAARARCRNKEAGQLTDDELRTWLEDVSDMTE